MLQALDSMNITTYFQEANGLFIFLKEEIGMKEMIPRPSLYFMSQIILTASSELTAMYLNQLGKNQRVNANVFKIGRQDQRFITRV